VVADLARHDDEELRRRMGQASRGFDPSELGRALERAGFALAECRSLPPEPGARGPVLLLATADRAAAVSEAPSAASNP